MTLRAAVPFLVSATVAAWAAACGGSQPPPQCTIGRGGHAVRYILQEGTGACATRKGEIVGAQSYRVPGSGQPPTLALQPNALLELKGRDPDPGHLTYSSGTFTTDYPEADSFCTVPSTSEARQSAPASGSEPAVDRRYQWRNIRLYDSTAIPGTQWTAELTYTEGDCTARYKAVGVFPAVSCAVLQNGKPVYGDDGKLRTDPSLCRSRVLGLAIDPHFPIVCDGDTGLCMLDGEPPALK